MQEQKTGMNYCDSSSIIRISLPGKENLGLYTIYYCESDSLEHDTPAINSDGKFIWCSELNGIYEVYKQLDNRLKVLGPPELKIQCTFNLQEIFSAPYRSRFTAKNGCNILDWVNLLSDYLFFLKDRDETLNKNLIYIEMLSIYLFENSKMDGFVFEGKDGKIVFEHVIYYSIGKIMQNSTFL